MAEPKPSLFVAPDRVIFVATRQTPWASGRKTYTTPGPYAFPGWPTYTSWPLTASADPKAPCAVSVAGAIPNATASENRWRDVISGALRRVRGGEWPLIAMRARRDSLRAPPPPPLIAPEQPKSRERGEREGGGGRTPGGGPPTRVGADRAGPATDTATA